MAYPCFCLPRGVAEAEVGVQHTHETVSGPAAGLLDPLQGFFLPVLLGLESRDDILLLLCQGARLRAADFPFRLTRPRAITRLLQHHVAKRQLFLLHVLLELTLPFG